VIKVLPGVAVAALVGGHWLPAACVVVPGAAGPFRIPVRARTGTGVVLTFDDGPHVAGTPAVLEALASAGAHAVFFVSGEQVVRHPALVREVVAAGHELGLHGFRHETRRQWTRALLADDVRRAADAVESATGLSPTLYRPPHGVFSIVGLRTVRSLGLEPLLWSKWGRDWEAGATAASITRRSTRRVAARDVILLHDADHYGARDSWRRTVMALPRIVEALHRAGLTTQRWTETELPQPARS